VLAINAATFVMMIAAAMFSSSSSLLSGALDNLGDAVTYALSFAVVGATLAAKARVALFKGLMIVGAALAVAWQIGWRVLHPEIPVVETMGVAAAYSRSHRPRRHQARHAEGNVQARQRGLRRAAAGFDACKL
jgi:Co/Zn/Cd efflux system component